VGKAFRGRVFWIIAATVCLPSISVNGAVTHFSALLTDRGVSSQGAAYAIATIGATALIGRLVTGMFLDRFFGPRVYQTILLMSGSGIALLSVAHTLPVAMIAASLIGFSTGGEADITPYLIGRYFGLRRLSTLYAFTWTSYSIGSAIGPLVVGRLFDSLGSYRPATIQLLALPAFIPCVLMFLLPRYADRDASRAPTVLEPFAEVPAANISQ
jgi:MFS family permease